MAIRHAATYFPGRVECLESSIALAMLLFRSGIRGEFKIGVQRYAFLAHAWVEIDGEVIGDLQFLARKIVPIVSI